MPESERVSSAGAFRSYGDFVKACSGIERGVACGGCDPSPRFRFDVSTQIGETFLIADEPGSGFEHGGEGALPDAVLREHGFGRGARLRQESSFVQRDGSAEREKDLAAFDAAESHQLLEGLGLTASVDSTPVPSDQPAGTVASTDPSAGSSVDPGSSVTIQVSSGQQTGSTAPPTGAPTQNPTPTPSPGKTDGNGGGTGNGNGNG